jgi:putative hydrolase of the HAD superfamily
VNTSPVQAVTFDVGGTLIQPRPSVGHVYAQVAARHGITAAADELDLRFRFCWTNRKDFNHSRAGWEALVDEVFDGLTPEPPSRTFFPELYAYFAEPEAWHVFEDVVPALEMLRQAGMKAGIISNWDERLRGLLRKLRLLDCFQVMAISCEVGAVKPAPAIFHFAASQFGLTPQSILHVGDDPERDVRGAAAADFRSVQIQRTGPRQSGEPLRSLAELPTWIARTVAKSD